MHCKGHSRDESKVAEGNQLADCQARKVALYETPSLHVYKTAKETLMYRTVLWTL